MGKKRDMFMAFRSKPRLSLGRSYTTIDSTGTSANTPSLTSSASLPPGDQPVPIPLGYKVSPLEVRDLNELIRKRYALDIEIWSKRNCKPRDRYLVQDLMDRSDATLLKIMGIVRVWDRRDVWASDLDWDRLRLIKQRLEMEDGKKRHWAENPPWES